MSVQSVLARVAELQGVAPAPPPAAAPPAAPPAAAGPSSFAALLTQRSAVLASPAGVAAPQGDTPGARLVAAAAAEVGQAEQPPGSNDSPRIAQYRTATAGSGVGPWCAYFTSWAAQQAGVPLGEQGQGFGAVAAVGAWADRTGRTLPPGQPPQPGDLVLWGGRHIGLVESVGPDGSISTIEGNSSNAVTRRTYGPDAGGATSYVRPS